MRIILTLSLLFIFSPGITHPSLGIVVDNNGLIYFTDVLHNNGTLWQANNEGKLTEIFSQFHAHNLFLDGQSNLWLAGSPIQHGGNKEKYLLIKTDFENLKDTVITTFDNEIFNIDNFTIGIDGKIFFENKNRIYQYHRQKPKLYIDHTFSSVKSILIDKRGTLWVADSDFENGTLFKLKKGGALQKVATGLMPENPTSPLLEEKSMQFITGIAEDENGNIYICENSGCRIIKINTLGERTVFYQSPTMWNPMNVTFYKGEAYILEIGYNKGFKGPRIIKKSTSGTISRIVNVANVPKNTIAHANEKFIIPNWVYFAFGLLIFSLIIIIPVKKQYNT